MINLKHPINKFYAVIEKDDNINLDIPMSYHAKLDLAKRKARGLWLLNNGNFTFYIIDLNDEKKVPGSYYRKLSEMKGG